MSERPARVVQLTGEIACSACGYNLRGLAPQGRCPECGQDVSVSLAEFVLPEGALVALDPRWRWQMIEAVVLALIGLAAAVCSALSWPREWEIARTGANVPVLLVGTWWVLQWYSALKLARADPAARSKRFDRWVVWGLRLSATAYLTLPVITEVRVPPGLWPFRPIAFTIAEYCGMLAAVLYFLRIRFVFARLGCPVLAAQALLLAWLMALVAAPWSTPAFGRLDWPDYNEPLVPPFPSFQFGPMRMLAEVVRRMSYPDWDAFLATAYIPVSLAAIALLFLLLVKLLRAGRPPLKSAAAASGGRSAASSSP
jgi:hypothetical protein